MSSMKRLLILLMIISGYLFILPTEINAQSLMQKAKIAEQQAKELLRKEKSRYNEIIDSRNISLYQEFIKDYPNSKNSVEIRNRIEELEIWNSAKSNGTIESFQNYLTETKYNWFEVEAVDAINKLRKEQETQEWEEICSIGSIAAYKQYLSQHPESVYKEEAEKFINREEGREEWVHIMNSEIIDDFVRFVSRYPYADEKDWAENRIHLLKGLEFYEKGNLKDSYVELSKIDEDYLTLKGKKAYQESKEFYDYSVLSQYSQPSQIVQFLTNYPKSKYFNEVSNMAAISLASRFGEYANPYDYEVALSYATDKNTKKIVKQCIDANKERQKKRTRENKKRYQSPSITKNNNSPSQFEKAKERAQNGGWINMGIEIMDLGYNFNKENPAVYYDFGLFFRIGNFKDLFQFALGVKPGALKFDNLSYDRDWKFHMPVVGQLKINLIPITNDSRFFAFGQFQYTAIRVKEIESAMSWSAGGGFAWKHVDWGIYYRKDIGRPEMRFLNSQHYIGTSIIYYFKL